MKAMAYQQYGGPEVLEPMDLPEPKVGPDWVLIRAKAASVNPVDYKLRQGGLDAMIPAHFPVIPGYDVAGVVERVGPAVPDLQPGAEVVAYNRQDHLQWGTYAELVAAPLRAVGPKPEAASWEQAGALPLVGLTAYQTLTERLDVRAGETVLVHAASGGVGRMAVQIARILGAEVIGTASERNHDLVRELGATPVAYGDGLVDRVRELRPDGVDAVLDLAGGKALDDSPAVARDTARITSIVDPRVLELGGQYLFVRPDREQLARLAAWVDEGRLQIDVGATLPLADAAEAQRMQEAGEAQGKIVLTM
ncbi:NADP-dependent oxidoreductase [Pseudonocardia nigra]|uniref:NADP-dependent oxidoreductase n=1 Tax=Pseudonocardia nigra TaxID=1921578 RepID=UPI001C5ECF71|nr:NADP-dependent oxidoreductase [Pseudonocardia nigra]